MVSSIVRPFFLDLQIASEQVQVKAVVLGWYVKQDIPVFRLAADPNWAFFDSEVDPSSKLS